MIDGGEADDKIIAVLENDDTYGGIEEISEVPKGTIDRLHHYFLTYKQVPGKALSPKVQVSAIYNRSTAYRVIKQSMRDYEESFGSR
jgi:inorganic pyrophosphatase